MPLLSKPKYPVVDADPSWGRVISNFNVGDVGAIGAFTGLGWAVGFFGSSMKLRGPMSRFNMGIGFMAGTCFAVLSSSQRLLGLEPNFLEVNKWGAISTAEQDIANNRKRHANIELIDDGTKPRQ
jgi:hypothetical protein